MSFKNKLAKETGMDESLLPSSYQIVGDIMLIKFLRLKTKKQKKIVIDTILKIFPHIKTICEIKQISGEYRKPKIVKLVGKETITTHKENDVMYKIDVSKLMFSKGNLSERKRLIDKIKTGETIVDMFAGIGYFSLGISKFSSAARVYAIEKNKVAAKYLKENIKINKLKNITPLLIDCRKAQNKYNIQGADRIIMGYFPATEKFLKFAIKMGKPGTIIHFHNTYQNKELWEKPIEHINKVCEGLGIKYKILECKKVKSFAPNVFHVVIDFQII